jgi:hypothetical protein
VAEDLTTGDDRLPSAPPEKLPEPAVRQAEVLPDLPVEQARAELDWPADRPPPSRYAPRFRLLTGALVGIALGAIAATGMVIASQGHKDGPPWSPWKPAKGGTKGAEEIAQHIAPNYRLPTGDQLVLVTGGPLKVAALDLPVRIAMSNAGQDIKLVGGKTVLYTLCGLGARCAIDKGKPSTARFLLLRREALELALYSFRYLGIYNVVTLLPPAPGKKPDNALFFRKGDLNSALDQPLRLTLPNPPPSVESVDTSPEAPAVRSLTGRQLFSYSFEQGQDLGAFLVLAHRNVTE